jgi:hypothetical protein
LTVDVKVDEGDDEVVVGVASVGGNNRGGKKEGIGSSGIRDRRIEGHAIGSAVTEEKGWSGSAFTSKEIGQR